MMDLAMVVILFACFGLMVLFAGCRRDSGIKGRGLDSH